MLIQFFDKFTGPQRNDKISDKFRNGFDKFRSGLDGCSKMLEEFGNTIFDPLDHLDNQVDEFPDTGNDGVDDTAGRRGHLIDRLLECFKQIAERISDTGGRKRNGDPLEETLNRLPKRHAICKIGAECIKTRNGCNHKGVNQQHPKCERCPSGKRSGADGNNGNENNICDIGRLPESIGDFIGSKRIKDGSEPLKNKSNREIMEEGSPETAADFPFPFCKDLSLAF